MKMDIFPLEVLTSGLTFLIPIIQITPMNILENHFLRNSDQSIEGKNIFNPPRFMLMDFRE